jgi:hypothetical protein
LLTIESSKKHITSSYLSKFFVNKKLFNKPFHQRFLLMTSAKILVVINMMINHERMVSSFPKQTVEKRGSLVFCICKSYEAERERVKSLERNERVCGECPTQILILMENLCLKDAHTGLIIAIFSPSFSSYFPTILCIVQFKYLFTALMKKPLSGIIE